MTVEAKFTTAEMTKGKRYNVIEEKKSINGYKIVLDNGTVAVRHKCGFNVVEEGNWSRILTGKDDSLSNEIGFATLDIFWKIRHKNTNDKDGQSCDVSQF